MPGISPFRPVEFSNWGPALKVEVSGLGFAACHSFRRIFVLESTVGLFGGAFNGVNVLLPCATSAVETGLRNLHIQSYNRVISTGLTVLRGSSILLNFMVAVLRTAYLVPNVWAVASETLLKIQLRVTVLMDPRPKLRARYWI